MAYFIRKNAELKSKWLIKKNEGSAKRHQGVENISQAWRAKRIKPQTLPVNLETLSLKLFKLSLSSSIETVWMKMFHDTILILLISNPHDNFLITLE